MKTLSKLFSVMKVQNLKKIFKSSYSRTDPNLEGYVKNKQLSGKRAQVYYNPKTNEAIVSHRGSQGIRDWVKTNPAMALGYEGGARFKHAQKIQNKAEKLYGRENVTTVGHSLGGRLAEKVGQNSGKIITYNKAVTPRSLLTPTSFKQTDVRTKNDVVSSLGVFQRKKGGNIVINSNSNVIRAHGLPELNKIKNTII